MSLPRYPAYKDSGVAWLGEVPAHWTVQRLKRMAAAFPSNVDKKSVDGEVSIRLCNYTDVYYNDRIVDGMELMEATATREQIEKFSLRGGDVIITKDSETADDIAIAAYVPENLPGVVCGYHLSVIRPKPGCSGAFIKWLFGSAYVRSSFEVRANGLTRVGLGQYAVDNVELPCPPAGEQAAIAAFLDFETARIDALVAEQERLIERLREKRHAVIAHAVTEGLNPSTPMKDSHVEWFGRVPSHWSVGLLKRLFRSVDYGISDSLEPDGAIAVLRMGNIGEGVVDTGDLKFTDSVDESLLVHAGDLLFNRTNSLDLIGKVGLYRGDFGGPLTFASYLVRIRTRADVLPEYLAFLLNTPAILGVARALAFVAIGQCNLNPTRYGQIQVAVPPPGEQAEIVAFLQGAVASVDALVLEARRTISLLGERRAALISAAVTGQIDVRGLVAEGAA